MPILGDPEEDRHCWTTQQECVVCGTVYVTETEKKVVEGSSATAKGKEKTFESPAVHAVRSIKEQAINDGL